MIRCISFNLNKVKDDHPILITRAKCQVLSAPPTRMHVQIVKPYAHNFTLSI